MRLLRLAKLLRIFRAGRIFQRWESKMAVNYSSILLLKFTFFTIMVGHWLACGFHLIIVIEANPVR